MDTEIGIKNNNNTRSCQDYDNEYSFSTKPLHTDSSHLQHLNEYCLLGIFSNKTLTLNDLCSLAETCECFKRITQCVFPKDLDFSIDSRVYIFESKSQFICFGDAGDVTRILKNFGSYIRILSIMDMDPTVINAIEKYCSNGSIKRMNILTTVKIEKFTVELKSIFQNLSTLTLDTTSTEKPKISKLKCDSLIELQIHNAYYWSDILRNSFPRLKRFTCVQNSFHMSIPLNFNNILNRFIARHKCLKKLHLSCCEKFRTDLAHTISSNCKELEELYLFSEVKCFKFDFTKLHCLKKLRVLNICIQLKSDIDLVVLFEGTESLEILKICRMNITSDMLLSLSKLPNFHELYLKSCSFNVFQLTMIKSLTKIELFRIPLSNTELVYIIAQLTNLDVLSIKDKIDIINFIESSYDTIVKIVEQTPNRILKIKGYFSKNFLDNFEQRPQVKLIR